jgi:hypothetical protein
VDGEGPRASKIGRARWLALSLGIAVVGGASASHAQHVAEDRPLSVIVGPAVGAATMERLDVARSNVSALPLPTSSLRMVWTRHVSPLHEPPVVLEDGTVVLVSDDGGALFINRDGTDRGHVSMGPGPTSAPSLLADGTVLVLNGSGDVVGANHGAVTFRAHVAEPDEAREAVERAHGGPPRAIIGRVGNHVMRSVSRSAPREEPASTRGWILPLDDGGAVVAAGRELVCIDAVGGVRARATAPVSVASPLLATSRGVAFVADNGDAYVWDRRAAPDAVSARGSFGGTVEGAVAAEGAHTLVAIVDGSHLASLDLATGETITRVHAGGGAFAGVFTGAFALEPLPGGTALVEEMTLLGTRVLAVDHEGHETPFATLLTPQGAQPAPDAGAAASLAPTHTALFADPRGSVAYGTVDGHVGVASPTSKVELGSLPCGSPPSAGRDPFHQGGRVSAGFAGLVPAGPGAFVIACEDGRVSFVQGSAD